MGTHTSPFTKQLRANGVDEECHTRQSLHEGSDTNTAIVRLSKEEQSKSSPGESIHGDDDKEHPLALGDHMEHLMMLICQRGCTVVDNVKEEQPSTKHETMTKLPPNSTTVGQSMRQRGRVAAKHPPGSKNTRCQSIC
jgi:hypothetical protein